MKEKFEESFGDGNYLIHVDDNDVEVIQRGSRRRRIGIPLIVFKAHFLDPRFSKLYWIQGAESENDRNDLVRIITAEIVELITKANSSKSEMYHNNILSNNNNSNKRKSVDTLTALIEMVLPDVNNNNNSNNNNGDETVLTDNSVFISMAKVEINKYLNLSASYNNNGEFIRSDPLEWYRVHNFEFPNVAILARKYLCISATSAPSERMFSNCGSYVTKKRNQLEPDIVNDFIFLNSSYKFDDKDQIHKKVKK